MGPSKKKFSKADQEKWAEERASKVEAAQDALKKGLAALVTGDDWKSLLQRIASNARTRLSPRRYSFSNQMIVACYEWAMGVDGSAVGTFNAWKRVGRTVKKGSKAVYILQPRVWKGEKTDAKTGETKETRGVFFRPLPVFMLGQTEGEELPPVERLTGEIEDDARFEVHLQELREVALAIEGTPVRSLTVRPRKAGDAPVTFGWYVRGDCDIVVLDTGNRSHMFKTAVHEVAHALMHGVDHHGYAHNECEAESVAFIVASVFGLDTGGYSFPYVATWAKRNAAENDPVKVVQKSGERIMRAVNTILDALLGEVDGAEEDGDAEVDRAATAAATEAA
jgi:hypothetical protein